MKLLSKPLHGRETRLRSMPVVGVHSSGELRPRLANAPQQLVVVSASRGFDAPMLTVLLLLKLPVSLIVSVTAGYCLMS